MSKLAHGTWVLVADGEKALLLRNETDAEDPHLKVVGKEKHDNPPDRDQKTDRPGRAQDTGVQQRSSFEETDYHRMEKERFAEDLADLLLRHARRGDYETLVIAAAPRILGALRPALHKEVQGRVVAEIAKDFTDHPVDELERRISAEV